MPSWASKGKGRAVARDEGAGGAGGIVLPLGVTSSSAFDIAYTLNVYFGADQQNLSLQVDTGSSDLWATSKACTSSLCGQVNGRHYDPSGSTSTGKDFKITYLDGQVSGPIVWDTVQIGGYGIENQAFAAADDIQNEPLSPQFNGVLGLALPLNSIIAGAIPPVTGNSADGAAWASNLFSITPASSAPVQRFLSLSLSRPGSSRIPAQLGIGRHPAELVPDPSHILYSTLVSERTGTLFWKVGVRAITVYVNGQPRPVDIGRSNSGAAFPSAVLDSGVPLLLTTSTVANAIYGAIGINPASDGNYYVPCTTPLNLTITIDNRPEIPLHPLDLTTEPPKDIQSDFCIGLIQPANNILSDPNSKVGDIILGVPFLRNVYTVMAYAIPNPNGTFPQTNTTGGDAQNIAPRLGLMALTDPTTALEEFKRVRVFNQPIDQNATGGGTSGSHGGRKGGNRMSVGIIALIAILGFFALCFALFGLRWWLFRRRFRRAGGGRPGGGSGPLPIGISLGGLGGEREGKGSGKDEDSLRDLPPTEDVMRTLGYEAYMQYNQAAHDSASALTTGGGVGEAVPDNEKRLSKESEDQQGHRHSGSGADELGYRRVRSGEPWWTDPDETLVAAKGGEDEPPRKEWEPEDLYVEPARKSVEDRNSAVMWPDNRHERSLSLTTPLLEETEEDCEGSDEFGAVSSMAGVGTAARGGRVGSGLRRESDASVVGA